jgi:putative flippase GtrA
MGVTATGGADRGEQPESRLEVVLEHLSYWPVVGGAVRLARRRREQVLYLVVGLWNTVFGYLVWALFQYLLHDYIYYLVILVLAWFPAVLNAYVGYRIVVFRSKGNVWRELPRFSLVYVGTLCVGLVGLPILLHVLPFNIYVTQALYTVAMVMASYLAHKFFSFRHRAEQPTYSSRDEKKDTVGANAVNENGGR